MKKEIDKLYSTYMKKIALITFHSVYNCGAFLQAFALQKVLNSEFENVNCEILDFQTEKQKQCYARFLKNNSLENTLKNIWIFLHTKKSRQQAVDFKNCQNKYLKLSQLHFSNSIELSKIVNEYDAFMSGSDQIWNVNLPDFSDAFYLDFVQEKLKISYATSFGSKINTPAFNEKKEWIKSQLLDYRILSVRENIGQTFIKNLIHQDAPIVLDPTMLLTVDDYSPLCAERVIQNEYIFLYTVVSLTPEIIGLIAQFSKQVSLPVVVMTRIPNISFWKNGFQQVPASGPQQFLSLIKYARYVLSFSFHGSLFSILYKKDFYSLQYERGNCDDRITTLLQKFGLMNRVLTPQNANSLDISPVNYFVIDPLLKKERNLSMEYLLSAIELIK